MIPKPTPGGSAGVELVIFDFDGVLVDSEVISARMLVAELALYDIHVDLPYIARHFLGRSYPVVLAQIRAEFGIDLPKGFEAAYRARLLDAFAADLKIIPGVMAVLERLAVPFCIATSSSQERVKTSMQLVGLRDIFGDRFTTASEVSRGKPAPDLFLRAAQKHGTDPARCLVIEDSLPGIRGALAAGMEVWHFRGGSHLVGLDLSGELSVAPQRHFTHFDELPHLAPGLFPEGE
ncbi:HAD family hydrolase [Pseudooceanicola algae]|uniref:6-phosphogluconate phosphatase n=1 Tax=Pseudooceanicola algae TaxID=1537215 RepID=A0A418SDP8_9RHOB|nr:HAD family hydrolase [Pseudooceanicola algae]QPM89473.1 6-phosphogluconate phosphatase [Pseudooceanicola algae]